MSISMSMSISISTFGGFGVVDVTIGAGVVEDGSVVVVGGCLVVVVGVDGIIDELGIIVVVVGGGVVNWSQ